MTPGFKKQAHKNKINIKKIILRMYLLKYSKATEFADLYANKVSDIVWTKTSAHTPSASGVLQQEFREDDALSELEFDCTSHSKDHCVDENHLQHHEKGHIGIIKAHVMHALCPNGSDAPMHVANKKASCTEMTREKTRTAVLPPSNATFKEALEQTPCVNAVSKIQILCFPMLSNEKATLTCIKLSRGYI